ncbi:MAG: hypothetical protein M3O87_06305 [Candidatus Dormibacteraeota bacterium]|nr:hypothetical protein [Candidatus Dormibacteraeota bacterium]
MIALVLLVAALVLFVIAAFAAPHPGWHRLTAAGLACWVASALVAGHLP